MFIRLRAGYSRSLQKILIKATLEDVILLYKSIILWRHSVNMILYPRRSYFYEKYIKKKFAKQIRSLLGYLLELYRSCALRHDMFAQNSEVLGIFPTNVKGDSTLANLNFFLALYWHISTGQNQDTSTSVPKMTPKSFKIASFSLYQALKSPQKFRQLWVAAPLTFWVPYVL